MSDWRSYDTVAEAYERVAAPRFQIVARHLLSLATPKPGARLLDLGTGTGVVPAAASATGLTLGAVVGCDLSSAMLARASLRMPGRHAVRSDVVQLPFVGGAFDVATANCVLSHVGDRHSVLREVGRVLARPVDHVWEDRRSRVVVEVDGLAFDRALPGDGHAQAPASAMWPHASRYRNGPGKL